MRRLGLDILRRAGCARGAASLLAALALGCAQNPKGSTDPADSYRRTMYTPDYARLYDNPTVYQNAQDPKAAEEYRKAMQELARINQQLQAAEKSAK